mgnify:CR=1 FL=1
MKFSNLLPKYRALSSGDLKNGIFWIKLSFSDENATKGYESKVFIFISITLDMVIFFRWLMVKFRNEEGGIAREWLHLLSREMLNPHCTYSSIQEMISVVCKICHEEFSNGRQLTNHRHSHTKSISMYWMEKLNLRIVK